jgi:hypothetical protein
MNLAGIVGLLVLDVLVIGTWVAWKLWSRRSHRKYVDDVKLLDKASLVQRANKDLCDGFARSRGPMAPFEFDFADLSLELPKKKKKILEDVTGTISPGTVTVRNLASSASELRDWRFIFSFLYLGGHGSFRCW